MRIFYINAMGPKEKAPQRGIFVTQRIKALENLNIEVKPIACDIEYSRLTKWLLKKMAGFPDYGEPLSDQMGVHYHVEKIRYNFFQVCISKINPKIFSKKVYMSLKKDLKDIQKGDIIHLHWLWPAGLGVVAFAKEKKIPLVITCHGSEINYSLKDRFLKESILEILESADRVEFISEALRKAAMENGYSGKNSCVIYNGIHTKVFSADTEKEKNEIPVIGFVGNLISVKGADRLPEIFKKIYLKLEKKVCFTVVGQGGLKESLQKEMADLPVRFTGVLSPEKLADEYRKMDVLVVPSRNEGYSCVVKEAQGCGVVAVGNNVGGIKEAIGEYGELVEADTEEELSELFSERVVAIVKGKIKIDRKHMEEEAAACSWEERQKESIELYHEILDKKS